MGEFPLKDGRSDFALRKKVLAKQVARLEIQPDQCWRATACPLASAFRGNIVPPNHQRSP